MVLPFQVASQTVFPWHTQDMHTSSSVFGHSRPGKTTPCPWPEQHVRRMTLGRPGPGHDGTSTRSTPHPHGGPSQSRAEPPASLADPGAWFRIARQSRPSNIRWGRTPGVLDGHAALLLEPLPIPQWPPCLFQRPLQPSQTSHLLIPPCAVNAGGQPSRARSSAAMPSFSFPLLLCRSSCSFQLPIMILSGSCHGKIPMIL